MSSKGWEGDLRVATSIASVEDSGSDEPGIQSVSPTHGNSLEAIYKLGSRLPVEVKEGNIEISIDITANYQGDTTWTSRCGLGSSGALTAYYVAIYPQGALSTNPELRFLGKFGNYSLDVPQDGVATESMTFTGTLVAVGAAWIG